MGSSAAIDLLSRQHARYGLLPGMLGLVGPAAFLRRARAAGVFNGIGRVRENHHARVVVFFRPVRNLLGNLDRCESLILYTRANVPLAIERTGLNAHVQFLL